MSTIEWIVLAALLFAVLIFCARLARRGLTTLDDDRHRQEAKIAEGERKLEEDRKNMSAHEHLSILQAGLEDLARLDNHASDWTVIRNGSRLEFHTPESVYEIELLMRERLLKSNHKVLHGKKLWLLRGPDFSEEHGEISTLSASLSAHLHGRRDEGQAPEHIMRRLRKPLPRQRKKLQ